MTARICQYLIAAVFLMLGGWALFAPSSVIELALSEPYRENTFVTRFMMACFGAQAVMFGIMALVVRWGSRAFATFAVVLLPFFAFNWYFHYEVPVLTSLGMLDFAGNLTMFIACVIGWRAAKLDEHDSRGIRSL
ncbi:hypothetical protein CD351_07375 [Erythrobacter sp. KY5]|uniref:hypothetical protein n=1 Tax=Erythrobacter sp. KY5 TaxID=2011159 RepID=UPI000DBF30F5|nr:hypothetical protein [Erythrobacter sp. KY5]AWW74249.1 hypothetical protein CD351_07375 [Erythrobacter sp. KY5]